MLLVINYKLLVTPLSYQILPNIIFLVSIAGIVLIVLRRLPEANAHVDKPAGEEAQEKLIQKGLPARGFSKISVALKLYIKKIWNFALEAKDLKPHANVGYKMKKIFGGKLPSSRPEIVRPQTTHEVKTESYYLENIKLQPKNLSHYDALGKFYLEQEALSDARDIYQYLVNHEPSNPEFHARLAFCFFKEKNYAKASEHYGKSVALDSTQPNRYYNLGLSQEMDGQAEEAIKSLEQAIALEPSEKYYKALAQAYGKLDNDHKAREAMHRAKKLKGEELEAKKRE